MTSAFRSFLCFMFLTAAFCAGPALSAQQAGALHKATSSKPPSPRWLETRLFLALGPSDDASKGISESGWRDFLDHEVTTRFPDGLSVLDVYGQWRDSASTPVSRERSKMILIEHKDNREDRAKIEAIRNAWKRLTGDKSVLRVTQPASVSF